MSRKRCFDPVVDDHTRLLVLGSLPGDKSLAVQEYYGNRQNKFWELVGQVINIDLRAMAYEARLATLREHGIGLWDVVAEAHRGWRSAAVKGSCLADRCAIPKVPDVTDVKGQLREDFAAQDEALR